MGKNTSGVSAGVVLIQCFSCRITVNFTQQFYKLYTVNQIDRSASSIMPGLVSENAGCQKKDTAGLLVMHEGEQVFDFPFAQFSILPIPALHEIKVGALSHDKINTWVRREAAVFHDCVAGAPVSFSHQLLKLLP